MFYIRKTILNGSNYQLDRCFPEIHDASYGVSADLVGPDGFTRLSSSVFWWLINVRPGYLVFQEGNSCTLEPYVPCRFARQFGYDQLYVGNPSPSLCFSENLLKVLGPSITARREELELSSPSLTRRPTLMPVLTFVSGTSWRLGARLWNKYFVYQRHQIHIQGQGGIQGLPDAEDGRVPKGQEGGGKGVQERGQQDRDSNFRARISGRSG